MATKGKEIVEVPLFDLGAHTDFASALAALHDSGRVIEAVELGDGTSLVEKDDLIGVELLITNVAVKPSDKGGNYVVARGITIAGTKFVFADGGTGISKQLQEVLARHEDAAGVHVPGGLVRSDYIHPEHGAATTYYLDTAPAA
jgi:hypothetical protein